MGSALAPPRGARVLDAGCGDGLNARWLAEQGYRVTGVDIVQVAIERARATAAGCPNVELVCLDLVQAADRWRNDFDLWVDIKLLHCLWRDDDRQRYLATAAASLRPGGTLFLNCGLALSDVREHFPSVFASLDAGTQARADVLDRDVPSEEQQGIRCETLEWYCSEIEQAGLCVIDATREASMQSGWGAILVANKGGDGR